VFSSEGLESLHRLETPLLGRVRIDYCPVQRFACLIDDRYLTACAIARIDADDGAPTQWWL
jgi:hypothetical protein